MRLHAIFLATFILLTVGNVVAEEPLSVVVKEIVHSGGYTYLRFEEQGQEAWMATRETDSIQEGDCIKFPRSDALMDFRPKSLNRIMLKVYFTPQWWKEVSYSTRPGRNQGEAVNEDLRAELQKVFKDLSRNSDYLDEINPYKKGTTKSEIFNRYMVTLLNNEKIAVKMVDMVTAYQDTNVAIKLIKAVIFDKMRDGLKKLPYEDLQIYFYIYSEMLKNSGSFADCAAMSRGKAEAIIYQILANMEDNLLEAWLRLVIKAIILGLDESVAVSGITKDQEEVAMEILFSGAPQEDLTRLYNISNNVEAVTDAELCWAEAYTVTRLNEMKDEPQMWAMRYMIHYITNSTVSK